MDEDKEEERGGILQSAVMNEPDLHSVLTISAIIHRRQDNL